MKYELREVDAWNSPEGWTWNTSYKIAEYTTNASDHKKAFLYQLHKLGIVCKRGMCTVVYDGSIYELQNRKDCEPLFAAIPTE